MKPAGIVTSLAIALLAWTTQARADDVNGAAKAFSQAQEVMLSGDVARAADLYELADELAPSAPALRNAARARLQAGHLAMAATNAAALLRRYPSDKESRDIAEAILSRLTPQLAQLDVVCTAACTLLVDGKVVASVAREQHSLFAQPGARTITGAFDDGRKASSQITATANRTTTVRLEAPPRPVARKIVPRAEPAGVATTEVSHSGHGISRWWVIGAGGVTVVAGGVAIISGMQTVSTRNKIRDAVAAGGSTSDPSTVALYNTGRDQQTRTNIFLGATIVGAAGTAVLAVFTNWSGTPKERDLAVVPARDGAALVYSGSF